MKIAILAPTLPQKNYKPGGVDVSIHRLANALSDLCDVTVFTLETPPDDARYNYKILFNGNRFFGRNWFGRILCWPILVNFIDFTGFNVVHLHGDDWFFINRLKPTIRTFHGSALFEAKTATSLKRKTSQYFIYILEKISNRLATTSVAISPHTAQIYKIDSVIGHGVDLEQYYPGDKTKNPTILFVGTWVGRKRGKFLYDGFINKILPLCPKAKLIMISDFAPKHKSVIWFKNSTDKDLAKLYRTSWIFAYPSLYEGFGLCYLEAIASGTAIVASLNSATDYLFTKENMAKLSSDQDFFSNILYVLNNQNQRKRLEQNGLKLAQKYAWPKIAQEYIKIYEQSFKKFK